MYPFSLRLHILYTPRIYKSKPDVNAFISFHYQKNQLSVQSKSNNRQSRMNSKEDTFFTLKIRFTLLFGSGRYFSGVVLRACSSIHVIRANLKKERTHYLCPSFHSTCLTIFPSDKRKRMKTGEKCIKVLVIFSLFLPSSYHHHASLFLSLESCDGSQKKTTTSSLST